MDSVYQGCDGRDIHARIDGTKGHEQEDLPDLGYHLYPAGPANRFPVLEFCSKEEIHQGGHCAYQDEGSLHKVVITGFTIKKVDR